MAISKKSAVVVSKLTIESLANIKPKTVNQQKAFDAWNRDYNLVLSGFQGVGKTYIALYMAMRSVLLKKTKADKLIIVRSIVPTRDIGFLKGSQQEKEEVYEDAYKGLITKLFPALLTPYEVLKKEGTINFKSTSFIRGTNIENAIVVCDEFQNLSFHELSSVITRLGENCRIIFSGDYRQSDLKYTDEKDGVLKFLKILDYMNEDFVRVDFGIEDCVRSGMVKRFLLAEHELEQQG